jgi:hypothetical protein
VSLLVQISTDFHLNFNTNTDTGQFLNPDKSAFILCKSLGVTEKELLNSCVKVIETRVGQKPGKGL